MYRSQPWGTSSVHFKGVGRMCLTGFKLLLFCLEHYAPPQKADCIPFRHERVIGSCLSVKNLNAVWTFDDFEIRDV
jgi:hypothetical protein